MLGVVARPTQHDQVFIELTPSAPVAQVVNVEMAGCAAVEALMLCVGQGPLPDELPVSGPEVLPIRHLAQVVGIFSALGPAPRYAGSVSSGGLISPDVFVII
jgi:hypothetical protein